MTRRGRFGDPTTEKDIVSAKRFNFLSLLVLIAGFAVAIGFYIEMTNRKKELEIKTIELADSTAILQRTRSELQAAQTELLKREAKVENQLLQLSDQVEQKNFAAATKMATNYSEQILRSDSSNRRWINFYAWQPDPMKLLELRKYLKAQNYNVILEKNLETYQRWLGAQSAVYYYSPKTEIIAKVLANNLQRISGIKFEARIGRMEDQAKTKNVDWFNIHYLGAEPERKK